MSKLNNKFSRRAFMAGGSAMAAVALSGIGNRAQAQSSNEVNLYSGRHYDTDRRIYEAFTQATGVKVNLVEGKSDALMERIKSEGSNSPADILITVDAGRLWRADQDSLFQPVSKSEAPNLYSAIPRHLRHRAGHWFGMSQRSRVILYNKELVNPADLSTYEDLADSKWRGKILIRSSGNIYNQSLMGELIELYGTAGAEDWARGFVSNFARKPTGNDSAQIRACAAGEGHIAIANTYYFPRFARKDDPAEREVFKKVGVFFPNQRGNGVLGRGAHMNVSGAGLVKSAPNRANALKFLNFMATANSQEIFAKSNSEYPVMSGIDLDPILESFGRFKRSQTNVEALGRNNPLSIQVMNKVNWDQG